MSSSSSSSCCRSSSLLPRRRSSREQHRRRALLARALCDQLPSLPVPQGPRPSLQAGERPRQRRQGKLRAGARRDGGRGPGRERGQARGGAALPEPGDSRDAPSAADPSLLLALALLPRLLLLLAHKGAALGEVVEAAEVEEGERVGGAVGLVGRAWFRKWVEEG